MSELVIITADYNSGKTTTALKVAEILGEKVEALVTVSHDGKENLYLKSLTSGEERLLMSKTRDLGENCGMIFSFSSDTFHRAEGIIRETERPFIMLDEVGRLEAKGKGFSGALDMALRKAEKVIICVRRQFIDIVTARFNPDKVTVLSVDGDEATEWALRNRE